MIEAFAGLDLNCPMDALAHTEGIDRASKVQHELSSMVREEGFNGMATKKQ